MNEAFEEFRKIHRWSRDLIITEKLDGTNAQVFIGNLADDTDEHDANFTVAVLGDTFLMAGSRTRWITPLNDNFGFAAWVRDNASTLAMLGPGRHFGEWWGQKIQRGYGLTEKRFSLFNVSKWNAETLPECCHVVPTLYSGMNLPGVVEEILEKLRVSGSVAAPGFMKPEGIVIFHVPSQHMFKKTVEGDEVPKGTRGA
jgi:hypothetical protein